MRLDVQKLQVLVTRPEPQNSELCEKIEQLGWRAVSFPTIAFASLVDEEAFSRNIDLLGNQDWLIFISPRAVYESVVPIRRVWPHFPPQVKLAAVGAGTAAALCEAGYTVSLHPTNWNSEGLLDLNEFQSVSGMNIAIIRGLGGRQLIDKVLTERGANILTIIAYQRMLPDTNMDKIFSLLKQQLINRIICTSFTGVLNLQQIVGEDHWSYLRRIPLIVVSERIKMLAEDLGFQTIWVAMNASNDAILEILKSTGVPD